MATYNVTTNFGAKDDLASGNAAKKIKGSEFTTEFTNISTAVNSKADTTTVNAVTTTANAALPKSGGAMTGAITTNSTFDGVDIATRDGVLTTTTITADAALSRLGGTMSGAIAMGTSKITGAGDPTDAQDVATKAYVDAGFGGAGDVTLSGNNAFTGNNTFSTEIVANAGIALGDNDRITFGTGDDLEIYHDGSDSIIKDSGTGILKYTSDTAGLLGVVFEIENTNATAGSGAFISFKDILGLTPPRIGALGSILYVTTNDETNGNQPAIICHPSDGVTLHAASGNGARLQTTSTGVAITGAADITTASAASATASTFKNGTLTAGKINTHFTSTDGYLSIGNKGAGLQFVDFQASRFIVPFNVDTNANSDNLIDLGNASARFDDIYATNATIQTSDRNEKQDIEELTEAETRVALACKGLLRKFRWKSAVEVKGNEARTHFGIIAQDLQAAFEAEGLDAGDYAMFTSSTWTNEDGEEQTRLGVRYSELLAFIIGGI